MTAKSSLLDECTREIRSLVRKFNEILVVVVCDREGATVLRVINDLKSDPLCHRNLMSQKLIGCAENISKMNLGTVHKIHVEYQDYQVVKFVRGKLIVTVISTNAIDTGSLFALDKEFATVATALQDYID